MKTTLAILVLLAIPAFPQTQQSVSEANPLRPGVRPTTGPGVESVGSLTLYTDRDDWATAASGVLTKIDFNSVASGTLITNQYSSLGVTGVSGTSPISSQAGGVTEQIVTSSANLPFSMFIPGMLPSEPNFLSNNLAAPVYATGELTIHFATPTHAAGAYYADSAALGGQTIEAFIGGSSLGELITPGIRNLPDTFIGIVSTDPFDSVSFSTVSSGDSWGLDDLEFSATLDVVIDFDDVFGQPTPFLQGDPVRQDALIDVFYHNRGVIFDSAGGGVAVVAPSNPVSPPNTATATSEGPTGSFSDPVTATFWRGDRPGLVDFVQTSLSDSTSPSMLSAFDEFGTLLGTSSGGASAILRVDAPGQIRSARIDQGPMAFDDFTFSSPVGLTGLALSPILPAQAGCTNQLSVSGAEPGSTVFVSVHLGLQGTGPRAGKLGSLRTQFVATDASGKGELSFAVPASAAGMQLSARAFTSTRTLSLVVVDVLAPHEGPVFASKKLGTIKKLPSPPVPGN